MLLGGAMAAAASGGGYSGRGALVGIGLNIYAVNNFSGPAAQAHKSLRALQNEYRRTLTENLRTARNTYGAMAAAGGFMVRGLAGAYRSFADFEYTMKGTQIVARLTAEQYKSLSSESLRLGETTMFRASGIAEQMRQMSKTGMSYEQVLNNIRAVVAGAGASMENMDTITRVMIATMSQFQIPAEGAMHTMDRLTAAALGSRATIESLGEGLKMSAADFYALNIPLEHALGTLMQMANFGIDNTMAGTAIGNMLRYLTKGIGPMHTGRQAQALEMLGFAPEDFRTAQGGMRDLVEIFTMLNKRIEEIPDLDKHAAYEALFGIRGKRGAMPLSIDPSQLRKNIETVAQSMGIAQNNLGKMMDSHKGGIDMLISAWDSFRIKFGEAISPIMGLLTQTLRMLTRVMAFVAEGGGLFKEIAKWVFSGVAGLLIWKTAVWAVKAAFAGLSLGFVSHRVTHKNMNEALHTMWDTLRAKVRGYNADLKMVVASQEILRQRTNAQFASSVAYNRSGRAYVKAGHNIIDPSTGKRFKGGSILPLALLQSLGMGAHKKSAADFTPDFTPRSRGKGIGPIARALGGGILGRLAGFMMGPWGMSLILLPSLISLVNRSLRKNSDTIDENTAQLKTDLEVKQARMYDAEFFNVADIINRNVDRRMFEKFLETQGEAQEEKSRRMKPANVIISIDGRRIYEERLNAEGSEILNNLGY